jgi:hypothetical protein
VEQQKLTVEAVPVKYFYDHPARASWHVPNHYNYYYVNRGRLMNWMGLDGRQKVIGRIYNTTSFV